MHRRLVNQRSVQESPGAEPAAGGSQPATMEESRILEYAPHVDAARHTARSMGASLLALAAGAIEKPDEYRSAAKLGRRYPFP